MSLRKKAVEIVQARENSHAADAALGDAIIGHELRKMVAGSGTQADRPG